MRPFLLTLLLVPFAVLAQGRPRLDVDATHFAFGKVAQGAIVTHRFQLKNAGDAPLTVLRVHSSCGCTTSMVGKADLAPGESTGLDVTFHAEGLQGLAQKTVQVYSNDPVAPSLTLTFEAEIVASFKVSEPELVFRDLVRKDRRKVTVTVESLNDQPLTLNDVVLSKAPWLGVATREKGKVLYVDLDFLARNLPPGQASGTDTITLRLGNPNPTEALVTVRWEKRPPVVATPDKISWAEPAGQDLTAAVKLKSTGSKPFRILSIRTSSPYLKASEAEGKTPSATRTLKVIFAGAPAGTYDEKIFLTLDTPGGPEFPIRVAAVLR